MDRFTDLMIRVVESLPDNRTTFLSWRSLINEARAYAQVTGVEEFKDSFHTINDVLLMTIRNIVTRPFLIDGVAFNMDGVVVSPAIHDRIFRQPLSQRHQDILFKDTGLTEILVSNKLRSGDFAAFTYTGVPAQYISLSIAKRYVDLPYYF